VSCRIGDARLYRCCVPVGNMHSRDVVLEPRDSRKGEMMTTRTRHRLATVVLAPAAAVITWGFIRLAGVDLVVETGDGTVGPLDVVVAALSGALCAWVVVRLLVRYTRRPGLWWPVLGSSALAVSTLGPTYLADDTTAVALTALHFVTAIVVITGFEATLPAWCDCGTGCVCGRVRPRDAAP
jgi:Family of unknown function (DUF6069)